MPKKVTKYEICFFMKKERIAIPVETKEDYIKLQSEAQSLFNTTAVVRYSSKITNSSNDLTREISFAISMRDVSCVIGSEWDELVFSEEEKAARDREAMDKHNADMQQNTAALKQQPPAAAQK